MFYIASNHYAKFRKDLEQDNEEAEVKASQYNFDDDGNSVKNYGFFT